MFVELVGLGLTAVIASLVTKFYYTKKYHDKLAVSRKEFQHAYSKAWEYHDKCLALRSQIQQLSNISSQKNTSESDCHAMLQKISSELDQLNKQLRQDRIDLRALQTRHYTPEIKSPISSESDCHAMLQKISSELDQLNKQLRQDRIDLRALQTRHYTPEIKSPIWLPSMQLGESQLKKYRKALSGEIRFLPSTDPDRPTNCVLIEPSEKSKKRGEKFYRTTLISCSCSDFEKRKGQQPCKHIYFLANQWGIPIERFFPDYNTDAE